MFKEKGKKAISELNEERKKINKALRKNTLSYLVAAFGLVAGLAWNNAITALINFIFPIGTNTILAKFIYAIIITIFVVLTGSWLSRILKEE